MSRIENTSKNFLFTVISTILTSVLGFITRTVFIHEIGITYLGANSLFTNILSMLSLTELGIGTAIAFSLYKPLADDDIETIKSLMSFYKKAYKVIAVVILILGLMLVPFLDILIKDPGDMKHINFIYLVFLYNTVVSYLFTYKVTLLSADQKSYIMTNINMIISVVTAIIQLIILISFKNYFIYLIIGALINTVQWFFVNKYIFNRYPYLKDKNIKPLSNNNKKQIQTNVKAMMFHKVGELCINQTDNIVISSFISISAVGLYNNYFMIINIINKFALSFFNAATASLGNLIATENCETQYTVFKRYNFLGFWVFGWSSICLIVLLNPFVEIWLGSDYLIDNLTIILVIINFYLVGMRTTIGNVKMAAGLYSQDQWAPIVQSAINLAVSVYGAIKLGLPGVFLGTVVSSVFVPCWYRPLVVYKYTFKRSCKSYFITYFKYILVILFCFTSVVMLNYIILNILNISIVFEFIIKCIVCVIVPNLLIISIFYKTDEFKYLLNLLKRMTVRRM